MVDNGPRILSLDIETSPVVAHAWGLFKQNIAISQIIEAPRVLCFAGKFMGERKVHFFSEFEHGRVEMIEQIHALLDEADIVMHYNGDRFDLPWLNLEFLQTGLTPPAPYKSIDLLKVVRSNFRFTSNKLAYVSEQLGLAGKVKHEGHDLWIKCLAGDPKAWAKMKQYNKRDVTLLEELYAKLQPWIKNHPNRALYIDNLEDDVCPNCASTNLRPRGFALTNMGKFRRFRCHECGAWSRSKSRVSGVTVTHSKD